MLAQLVPHPDRVDIIRHRVYTHHSRIAGAFRQGPADAGRRRRAPDAGVAGAGLQQRHPRRGQPRLEAGRGGQRPGRGRAAGHLRRRTAQARAGDDRPVHHGRAGHLADEPTGGGAARQGDSRRVGRADAQALHPRDAVQADAALRAGRRLPRGAARPSPRRRARCSSSPVSTPASSRTCCSTTCSAPASPCCAGATTRARCSARRRSPGGRRWGPSSLRPGR